MYAAKPQTNEELKTCIRDEIAEVDEELPRSATQNFTEHVHYACCPQDRIFMIHTSQT
jgi:hypothetical protein